MHLDDGSLYHQAPSPQIVGKTRKKKAREKLTRKVGGVGKALPSFLTFYFHVCAFSIQRTRLSRNLEQAKMVDVRAVLLHIITI